MKQTFPLNKECGELEILRKLHEVESRFPDVSFSLDSSFDAFEVRVSHTKDKITKIGRVVSGNILEAREGKKRPSNFYLQVYETEGNEEYPDLREVFMENIGAHKRTPKDRLIGSERLFY